MKRIIFILLIITGITSKSFSQRETDFGFSAGASYYMGDINTTIPFYSPNINVGAVYRYNFNSRYILKIEANYLKLTGSDLDFDNTFQQSRAVSSFNNTLTDFSAQFEFNFLPLKFDVRKMDFTPFISGGAAYAYSLNSTSAFALPAALGVKLSLGKNWTLGAAWNLRKTFTDRLDNVSNLIPESQSSILNNNDWYYFANVFITYKIFDFRAECPAYFKTY